MQQLSWSLSPICWFFMLLGLEVVERRLMDLVPAPAVRLMKSRVKSRPGVDSVQLSTHNHYHPAHYLCLLFCELDDSGCVLTVVASGLTGLSLLSTGPSTRPTLCYLRTVNLTAAQDRRKEQEGGCQVNGPKVAKGRAGSRFHG